MTRPLFAAPLLLALVACSSSSPPASTFDPPDAGHPQPPATTSGDDAGSDAGFVLPLCTQSPPAMNDGTVSATGTFPPAHATLVAGYADAWAETQAQPGQYSRTLHLTLVDHAGACASSLYHHAGEHALRIDVYDENGAAPLGSFTPGTFLLGAGLQDGGAFQRSIQVGAYSSDLACTGKAIEPIGVRGGTVTVTAIDATHVAGSFDLDFHFDGTRFQGTFDVPICPTSIPAPPEGQCCVP